MSRQAWQAISDYLFEMGFSSDRIKEAFNVYEEKHHGKAYNLEVIAEIIANASTHATVESVISQEEKKQDDEVLLEVGNTAKRLMSRMKKTNKRLREIEVLESKLANGIILNKCQVAKLKRKPELLKKLQHAQQPQQQQIVWQKVHHQSHTSIDSTEFEQQQLHAQSNAKPKDDAEAELSGSKREMESLIKDRNKWKQLYATQTNEIKIMAKLNADLYEQLRQYQLQEAGGETYDDVDQDFGAIDDKQLTAMETKLEAQLKRIKEAKQNRLLCVVCMDGAKNHVFLPCGHQCICGDCKDQYQKGDECPICRVKNTQIVQIYNA